MSDATEAVTVIGGGCLSATFLVAWCVFLPTVGLLYLLGFIH